MEIIKVKTHKQNELIDITAEVENVVKRSKIKEGMCYIYVPHTTAGVLINENADRSVSKDILAALDKMVPLRQDFYSHMEGNSAAHIKSVLVGINKTIFISDSKLCLGTWQGVYFCEFDGPRRRDIYVKIF
ncbi:MAG: secondary thiamine-phosphate synthase enzyme YjbQ [bacterium]|nr:secondary thiamine-phosphate synthase enzyme YjbQ [bacterium]